jgi:hypothetical protein
MPRKELLLFSSILLLGILDCLTTVVGVLFFGATEINPLLVGLTQTNIILFSILKLTAITFAGLAFYEAVCLTSQKGFDWNFTKRFVKGSYSMTFLIMIIVVSSNIVALITTSNWTI